MARLTRTCSSGRYDGQVSPRQRGGRRYGCKLQATQGSHQPQQDDRPYKGGDDLAYNACADVHAELFEKPSSEEGAQDADNNGADKADTYAPDEHFCQQPCNPADDDPDDDLVQRHVDLRWPRPNAVSCAGWNQRRLYRLKISSTNRHQF